MICECGHRRHKHVYTENIDYTVCIFMHSIGEFCQCNKFKLDNLKYLEHQGELRKNPFKYLFFKLMQKITHHWCWE